MPTKQDYVNFIIAIFDWRIKSKEQAFRDYDDNNQECIEYIKDFGASIKEENIRINNNVFFHNIGDIEEYRLFVREKDAEGFVVDKNIAKLFIDYGVCRGISIWLEDYATDQEICGIHYAR